MSAIRERIDPDGTLPDVQLEPYETMDWGEEKRERMWFVVDGEPIIDDVTKCTVYTQDYPYIKKVHFDGVDLHEDLRGRGIGLAAYVAAIELAHSRGLPFETQDHTQTVHARKIWEILVSKGVAEVIEPFQPSEEYPERFVGKYRVPVPGLPQE